MSSWIHCLFRVERRAWNRKSLAPCIHVCVCARVHACTCICVCIERERREVMLVWNWATENSEREHHYFYQIIGLLVYTFSTNLYPFLGPLASSAEARDCSPQTSELQIVSRDPLALHCNACDDEEDKAPTNRPAGTHSKLIPDVFSHPPSLSLQKMPQICFFSSKINF